MTTPRAMTAFSLTLAVLLTGSSVTQADTLSDVFRTVRNFQVAVNSGVPQKSRFHTPGYLPPPPSYCPAPPCHDPIVPPPPPVCRIYCVYKLDCHGHWRLYGEYRSYQGALFAQSRLQSQGYRTYIRVKNVSGGGYPGGGFPGGGYPGGGFPGGVIGVPAATSTAAGMFGR